jgi:large subunit ribosomal protein L18
MIKKRRRAENRTDYHARLNMLKGGKRRIVFRRTNKYIVGQFVESREAQDFVLSQANSKELIKFGWPEAASGSLKSMPACYLVGKLLGKRVKEKHGEHELPLDIGLMISKKGSRVYAFVKGVIDGGTAVKVKKEFLPSEDRIRGKHIRRDMESIITKVSKAVEDE